MKEEIIYIGMELADENMTEKEAVHRLLDMLNVGHMFRKFLGLADENERPSRTFKSKVRKFLKKYYL